VKLAKPSDTFAFLRQLWRNGDVCQELPSRLYPTGKHQAYAVQAEVEAESASQLHAWKIAATSAAGQKHIGVSGPLIGRYISEQCIENGGTIPFGQNRMRVAEVEFAFRFAHDIEPRAKSFRESETIMLVSSLHPAIEIPDSRYLNFASVGELALIADNACAHRLCIGPQMPETWRTMHLEDFKPIGRINQERIAEGEGRNVLGGPLKALTWFINEMSWLGVTIKKDQFVSTGTCLTPMPISPGDTIEGDFQQLGKVSLTVLSH
jgi:2-keto-4-pentenoate hydratase